MQISSMGTSFNDYPGHTSLIIFMSGCTFDCDGCQNPLLQDPNHGREVELSEIRELFDSKLLCKSIVFSGGDPLYQYESLLEACKEFADIDICVYTGETAGKVPKDLLPYINLIVTERYIAEKGPLTSPNTNQRVWDVVDGVMVENNEYFKLT